MMVGYLLRGNSGTTKQGGTVRCIRGAAAIKKSDSRLESYEGQGRLYLRTV